MCRYLIFSLIIIILLDNEVFALEKISRQKRCIVIQKQSGGKADSGEGGDNEDYDYKRPQPKDPPPDRLRSDDVSVSTKKHEVETIPPELLKYKKVPKKAMYRRLQMKRLMRNNYNI